MKLVGSDESCEMAIPWIVLKVWHFMQRGCLKVSRSAASNHASLPVTQLDTIGGHGQIEENRGAARPYALPDGANLQRKNVCHSSTNPVAAHRG